MDLLGKFLPTHGIHGGHRHKVLLVADSQAIAGKDGYEDNPCEGRDLEKQRKYHEKDLIPAHRCPIQASKGAEPSGKADEGRHLMGTRMEQEPLDGRLFSILEIDEREERIRNRYEGGNGCESPDRDEEKRRSPGQAPGTAEAAKEVADRQFDGLVGQEADGGCHRACDQSAKPEEDPTKSLGTPGAQDIFRVERNHLKTLQNPPKIDKKSRLRICLLRPAYGWLGCGRFS